MHTNIGQDFLSILNKIVSRVFPGMKYNWIQWREYTDDYIFVNISACSNPMSEYTRDHYVQVMDRFLQLFAIKSFSDEEQLVAEKLFAALMENCLLWHSDVKQDRVGITYERFWGNDVYNAIMLKYFNYCSRIMSILIMRCINKNDVASFSKLIGLYKKQEMREQDYIAITESLAFCSDEVRLFKDGEYESHYGQYWDMLHQLITTFPNLRIENMHFVRQLQELDQDFAELKQLDPIMCKIQKGEYWEVEKLPQKLEFDFKYPNGARGDMIKNLAEDYGAIHQVDTLTWHAEFTQKQIVKIDILIPDFIYLDGGIIKEIQQVYDAYLPHSLRQKVAKRHTVVTYNFKIYKQIMQKFNDINTELLQRRNRYYSQLVLNNKISPKWKSEAQLFVLVSSVFPDAVYQYHVYWLRAQSLDIYIPSIETAIEYQGKQHYEPVEHFGGVEHFKKQRKLDQKKRKLCGEHNVRLIEWPYTEEINKENLMKFLGG